MLLPRHGPSLAFGPLNTTTYCATFLAAGGGHRPAGGRAPRRAPHGTPSHIRRRRAKGYRYFFLAAAADWRECPTSLPPPPSLWWGARQPKIYFPAPLFVAGSRWLGHPAVWFGSALRPPHGAAVPHLPPPLPRLRSAVGAIASAPIRGRQCLRPALGDDTHRPAPPDSSSSSSSSSCWSRCLVVHIKRISVLIRQPSVKYHALMLLAAVRPWGLGIVLDVPLGAPQHIRSASPSAAGLRFSAPRPPLGVTLRFRPGNGRGRRPRGLSPVRASGRASGRSG